MEDKTRQVIFVAGLALLGAALLGVGIWLWIFQIQFALMRNDAYGVSIKYPKSWQALKDYEKTIFTFVSPPESAMDVFRENVNVVAQNMPNQVMTLQEYADLAAKQLTGTLENVKVLKSEPTHVGKIPAHRILFEARDPDQLMILVTFLLKGGKAYLITYTARSLRYEEDLKLVRTMIQSLTIQD